MLLRGLRADPAGRFPSMPALLTALETDPTVRARRAVAAVALAALVVVSALAVRKSAGAHQQLCGGGAQKWAGIWEPGRAGAPRNEAIHRAFIATGRSFAEHAFRGASRYLDEYATRWTTAYTDACEATHERGEQSSEVLDLRMGCLRERLAAARALTDIFASANGAAVENAVSAAAALPRLERCADVPLLKATVQPPEDEGARKKVADLEERAARLSTKTMAGQCAEAEREAPRLVADARAVGYKPALADALNASGHLGEYCIDERSGILNFREAYSVGLASRNDEAALDASASLSCFLLRNLTKDVSGAQEWLEIGRAMRERVGGHSRFSGWLSDADASILRNTGRYDQAIEAWKRSKASKERELGKDHPDMLTSANELGLTLEAAGRDPEAKEQFETLIATFDRVFGAEHPMVTFPLNNLGEVLNRLGRYAEARAAFERALGIWRRSGGDAFYIAYGLTGVGLSYLGEGRPAEALAPLTEALRIRTEKQARHPEMGETRFALARALWSQPAERGRARQLALAAREDYAHVTPIDVVGPVPNIDAWLRTPSASPPTLVLAARTAGPSESPGH